MSQADIEAGDRWGQEVARELASCNFGIICVTPENLNASWLLFEAGALAKSLEDAKVIPLLFDLELRDISGPLAQFQAKKFDKPGLTEVVQSINRSLPTPIADEIVNPLLDAMWPGLQTRLDAVPKRTGDAKKGRSQPEILEELVLGVRSFDSRLRDTEMFLSEHGPRSRRRKPKFLMEAVFVAFDRLEGQDAIALVVAAGFVREDFPWVSEMLMEGYRNANRGNWRALERLPEQLSKLNHSLLGTPFIYEMGWAGKDQEMMLMELTHLTERYVMRVLSSRVDTRKRSSEKLAES